MNEDKEPRELRYALKDYLNLCQKYKKAILFFVVAGALASGCLALTRNVYYLTTATFRDKGKPQTAFRSSLTDFIFSNGAMPGDSETISTLKSRKLLSKVIYKLGMQAKVVPVETSFPNLKDIHDNFFAEYAYWTKRKTPILADLEEPIVAKKVLYKGESPFGIVVQFIDEKQFKVLGRDDLPLGFLDHPFEADDYSFTLQKAREKTALTSRMFSVSFLPLDLAVESITSLMVIELDREDKTLLKLKFKHRNRHLAAEFLNTLMAAYQDYIKEDHEYVSSYQLEYLKNRQDEVGADLQAMMEKHAERISKDLSSSGFLDSEKEMDFLAANVHSLQQKISEIDFEKKRLEKLADLDFVYYDQYGGRGDSAVINQLLGEIRGIKQQIDVLNLSLEKQKKLDNESIRNILDEQFAELHSIRSQLKETEELSLALKSHEDISADVLFQPSQHLTPVWFSALNQINNEDQNCYRDQLCSYLDNLKNMLKLKEATISERIKHQHHPDQEFQGITLETARNLFYSYSSAVTELQGQIKQHKFIVEELKKPDFEVCSLTAILHDPISAERIAKASMLLINLRDENNRTQKEMGRLRDELNMLKQFLAGHIEQMIQLFTLREKLLQDKIYALQSLTLDLSYQQIYVLKKNLVDYLATRLENLDDEKKLIKEHQNDLNLRMAKIPSRWAAEKIVFQHLTSHQKFLENLSSMVESKNISKNLELIQSTPIDHALPSINPAPPRAVFYAILGSLLGLLGSVGFLIARSLITGIPASEDNIKLAQMHCSGLMNKKFMPGYNLLDSDLNTIRRSLEFLDQFLTTNTRKILFILGKGIDPSLDFASLLVKKGQRVIHLDLTFDQVLQENKNGILQYIEKGTPLDVTEMNGIHRLSAGGVSRYSSELLKRNEFKTLLETYQHDYDWTLAISRTTILDADALSLASLFDAVVLMITDETIEELKEFEEQLLASSTKVIDCLLVR